MLAERLNDCEGAFVIALVELEAATMSTRAFMTPIKIGKVLTNTFHEAAFALRQYSINDSDYEAWRLARAVRESAVRPDEHLEQRLRNWASSHPEKPIDITYNRQDDLIFE
jgi:hypothetical protein